MATVDHGPTTSTPGTTPRCSPGVAQDVTDLNRLARARYDQLGRLHGHDLTAPGGRRYAVGDRVVALAPNPEAQLVTSQQLTVTAVDHDTQTLAVQTDDGRAVASTAMYIDRRPPRPRLRPHRPPRPRRHLRPGPRLRRRRRTRARLRRHEPSPRPHHPPRRRRRLAQAIEDLQTDWATRTANAGSPTPPPPSAPNTARRSATPPPTTTGSARNETNSKPSHHPTPPTSSTTRATQSQPSDKIWTTCPTVPAAARHRHRRLTPGTRSTPKPTPRSRRLRPLPGHVDPDAPQLAQDRPTMEHRRDRSHSPL